MIVKTDVYINDVLLPRCSEGGISVTPNKLYASNSGRSDTTGEFIGDIVAIKYDISLSWDSMIEDELNILTQFSDSMIVGHEIRMMFDGKQYTTKECYIADLSRTINRQRSDGKLVYKDIKLHIVEV